MCIKTPFLDSKWSYLLLKPLITSLEALNNFIVPIIHGYLFLSEALEELQIPPYKEEEMESSTGESIISNCNGPTSVSPSATSPANSAASPASCSSKDSGVSISFSALFYNPVS